MASRRPRHFHHATEYLETIEHFRLALTAYQGSMPINDDLYRRSAALLDAIDDVVEVLTGDRTHFWLKRTAPPYTPPDAL